MNRVRVAVGAVLALAACSGSDNAPDAGVRADAQASDAGLAVDSGPADAGEVADAGTMDAAPPDAGSPPFGPVVVDLSQTRPPDDLSTMQLIRWRDGALEYNDRVVSYSLSTALFSDHALKARAIYVPAGATMRFTERGAFEFPVGSVILKTFLIADDLRTQEGLRPIETRLLVRYEDEWRAFPFVWNEELTDADYFVRGEVRQLEFIDSDGVPTTAQYLIPQKNQCLECHELKDEADERFTTPIGPRARYLNHDMDYGAGPVNQLQHFLDQGMLEGLEDPSRVASAFDWSTLTDTATSALDAATRTQAARDYLDINCAHCHRPDATQGMTSRLWLNWDNEDEFNLGFCKEPGSAGSAAAGRQYDIVPGDAEASILIYRTETMMVGDMMPLLGRSVTDRRAVGILRGWVDGLPPDDCQD